MEIWCKICAKHKHFLLADLKGAAFNSAKVLTEGKNNVKKHKKTPGISSFLSFLILLAV